MMRYSFVRSFRPNVGSPDGNSPDLSSFKPGKRNKLEKIVTAHVKFKLK